MNEFLSPEHCQAVSHKWGRLLAKRHSGFGDQHMDMPFMEAHDHIQALAT